MAENNGTNPSNRLTNAGLISNTDSSLENGNIQDAGTDDSFFGSFGDSVTEFFGLGGTGVNTDTSTSVTDPTFAGAIDADFDAAYKTLLNRDPRANVLHQYATYTYNLTLGAQTPAEYNQTVDSVAHNPRPSMTNILMSSGGKKNKKDDNFKRSEIFLDDFYIQHLKIDSIIGQNSYAQGSNSVNVEFSIFEPYGVSLIERMIALGIDLGYDNYMEIPFIMRIDFVGYNNNSEQAQLIPNTTKFIPMRFTSINFKVSGDGAAYDVTAIPYSQVALQQTIATIPTSIQVSTTTVGEFFKQPQKAAGNGIQKGLVETVNVWYKRQTISTNYVDAQRTFADQIDIKVHPSISKTKITVENIGKVTEKDQGDKALSISSKKGSPVDNTRKAVHIFNEKSSIISIINSIIKNSDFYLNQLVDGQKNPEEGKEFVDFRITTGYKLGEYDPLINRRAFVATYYVNPYTISGQSNNIGQARKPRPQYIAKEYDYYFTGKNNDIIKLDVEFNLAFYVHRSTDIAESSGNIGSANKKHIKAKKAPALNTNDGIGKAVPVHLGQSNRPGTSGAAGSKESSEKLKAAALRDSIMTTARGDLMVLDIDIFGDPEFIKQDDILVKAANITSNKVNGSVLMDNGELYMNLTFKIKEDPDHNTGLRLETKQFPSYPGVRNSSFNGTYRVMTLINNFVDGQFLQTITVMRVYNQ